MSTSPPLEPEPGPVPSSGWRSSLGPALDLTLRVIGGALAVVGAVLTAVLELIFATVRVGGELIGVSVVIAVVANVGLSWFAHRAVGHKAAIALPAVAWFALMVVAAGGTSEGDILLAGDNWVGLAMIFAGSMAFAAMAIRVIMVPRR